ncbi:hypothetical protein [Pseudomonas savastanoi]|uniref:hypothetical protein n=2 Tax=Pseudomonas syringae group genomosp. 2 TaxID=251698 RepID=UPI0010723662|nr:hypothetical protein [Pseudomonas savastanoi]
MLGSRFLQLIVRAETRGNTPFLDIEICTDLLDSVTPALPCLRLERGFCPKKPRLMDVLAGAGSVAANDEPETMECKSMRLNASSLAINLSQAAASVAVNLSRKRR